ncbi:MAG: hypothetical protein IM537_16430 [Pseudanabaena sp. M57BS1SP1A06MG]|nr:hypothetical protein [Pseudanabaena sp. M53BS1SP1A06MG]MCA6581425.1 hypothetical protein [Pseudanabaena sp. M34BS1SP1A06MG]MCA6591248.1 hypothetical protein [Pseudanabaena sp. M38BS1SP1A06MG]MCA6601740.1 hypothetical protein [Pseudanabaena sp. M57BS1SP1A06MG]MCA6623080.1 hypothetical protein [Pseudanabaena sp. M165S2SP1A06QC]
MTLVSDRCLMREIGDRVLWVMRGDRCLILGNRRSCLVDGERRSLLEMKNRRSGCMGDEGRSLFDWEIGDQVCGSEWRSLFDFKQPHSKRYESPHHLHHDALNSQ